MQKTYRFLYCGHIEHLEPGLLVVRHIQQRPAVPAVFTDLGPVKLLRRVISVAAPAASDTFSFAQLPQLPGLLYMLTQYGKGLVIVYVYRYIVLIRHHINRL